MARKTKSKFVTITNTGKAKKVPKTWKIGSRRFKTDKKAVKFVRAVERAELRASKKKR